MIIAKSVLLALALMGVAAAGAAAGVVHAPLQKAIDIHKEHLGQKSTMPEQSKNGQQNALDRLMENQQRMLANPHNEYGDDGLNEADDNEQNETDNHDLNETDDNEMNETDDDDNDEKELKEIGHSDFSHAIANMLNWMKTVF